MKDLPWVRLSHPHCRRMRGSCFLITLSVNGSPSSKFLFACGARTCHFPSLRCSEWSGWRRVCVFPRHPESRLSGRLWHRPRGPAAYSLPLTYLKILRARRLCWLECRPELRNHGAGWMRAVERLRNGGVPRNPVFLMPATHCTRVGITRS